MTARITRETAQKRLADNQRLTVGDLAALLGMHRQTIIRWLDGGLEDPPGSGHIWTPPHWRTPGGHRAIPPETARRLIALARGRRAGTVVAAGPRAAHDRGPATSTPASTRAGGTPPAVSFLPPEI